MADPHASYRALEQSHERRLDSLLQQGVYKPVFLYHVVLFNCIPLIGLVIPRRRGTRYVRHFVWAVGLGLAFDTLKNCRALLGGNGYMVGIMTAWWLVWCTTLFVFMDVEHDFQRIERGAKTVTQGTCSPDGSHEKSGQTDKGNRQSAELFHWQSYPREFSHRLDWCAGLLYNLRGPEWNWRVPHLGPLPQSVHKQLQSGLPSDKFRAEDDATFPTPKQRLLGAFYTCLQSYLLLDVLKVIMMRDPYFRGTAGPYEVPPFPLSYLAPFPLLIRFYHCLVSCVGIYAALVFATSFGPICFLGLSLAFPNASQKLTAAPLDKSWLYADSFGPFVSPILDHGLAGCWGRWWHQLFRYGFISTARAILSLFPTNWAANKQTERIVHIVVAFTLSGCIHACGSYTQFPETHPFSGPFLFFSLQSVAIICENIFKTAIFPWLPLAGTPRWLRRTANAVFVFCWLLFSGAFIADDFARGALWLVEPLPLSPVRGLYGEGWWCWKEPWFRYWSDGTYWGSGIRVI
ncbi:hypothetical protein PENDEC_c011G04799 [Penicillium decumbens]|uniref:Wax synthase domain-containing protein n=1 Tax=Penicillium decumbens TaxID=69771 RepID=A0A1V6PBX7_PENDC|nr:hypothetical protein PENDEC_c011G04799 [Penicillium decumbens]